jgi:hypothetical protein
MPVRRFDFTEGGTMLMVAHQRLRPFGRRHVRFSVVAFEMLP